MVELLTSRDQLWLLQNRRECRMAQVKIVSLQDSFKVLLFSLNNRSITVIINLLSHVVKLNLNIFIIIKSHLIQTNTDLTVTEFAL